MTKRAGDELLEALPNFGEHLGYGGKASRIHSTGRVRRDAGRRRTAMAIGGER